MHCASCKIAQWLYRNNLMVMTAIVLVPVATLLAGAKISSAYAAAILIGVPLGGAIAGAFAASALFVFFQTRAIEFHRRQGNECEIINRIVSDFCLGN